jgi:hypothetical protein
MDVFQEPIKSGENGQAFGEFSHTELAHYPVVCNHHNLPGRRPVMYSTSIIVFFSSTIAMLVWGISRTLELQRARWEIEELEDQIIDLGEQAKRVFTRARF